MNTALAFKKLTICETEKINREKNIRIQLSIEFISYLTHVYFVPNSSGTIKHK